MCSKREMSLGLNRYKGSEKKALAMNDRESILSSFATLFDSASATQIDIILSLNVILDPQVGAMDRNMQCTLKVG